MSTNFDKAIAFAQRTSMLPVEWEIKTGQSVRLSDIEAIPYSLNIRNNNVVITLDKKEVLKSVLKVFNNAIPATVRRALATELKSQFTEIYWSMDYTDLTTVKEQAEAYILERRKFLIDLAVSLGMKLPIQQRFELFKESNEQKQ